MLKRRERLRSSRDIDAVIRRGRRHNTSPLMIWAIGMPQGPLRVAILCSKKVDKRAVVRNKVKRRIREAVRTVLAGRLAKTDIVISAKPLAKELATEDFRKIFRDVFHIS